MYLACEKCLQRICQESTEEGIFWLDLIDYHIESRYVFFTFSEEKVSTLEKLGYILTHEDHEKIMFRLIGEQEGYFCIEPEKHSSEG